MPYYYEIIDADGVFHGGSESSSSDITEAFRAARDDIATTAMMKWPVRVRVYSGRRSPNDVPSEERTYYPDKISDHARKKIEEANRPELQAIVSNAIEEYELAKNQFDKGLLTPYDFAKRCSGAWTEAVWGIEKETK